MSAGGDRPPSNGHGAHDAGSAGHGPHGGGAEAHGTHGGGRAAHSRFAPGAGRPRPPHVPRAIRCESCGAPASIADERARSHACAHCGSVLELGEAAQRVIGRTGDTFTYPIEIGDSFRWRGTRFEVVARLAFVEDDPDDATRQYCLYNPRRGSLWLSEYRGSYDVSESTHVMPKTSPSRLLTSEDHAFETHDGRRWKVLERCSYRLAHVEGSLPWVARVGDGSWTLEAERRGEPAELFEIEESGDELELSEVRRLPLDRVRAALGKPDLPGPSERFLKERRRRRDAKWLAVAGAATLMLNFVGLTLAGSSGRTILSQRFEPAEITGEVLTEPFELEEPDTPLGIELRAPLDNAWMSVDWALVADDGSVLHVDDAYISYYHGRSGGENWSEGSRTEKVHVEVPEPGRHRLLLHAVSAEGETPAAREARHRLNVKVLEGALDPQFGIGFAAGVLGLIGAVVMGRSKE